MTATRLAGIALGLAFAACAAPKPKKESAIVEGSEVPATCCCKSRPMASEDGKPLYQTSNRMECSSVQGECVPDVQCQKLDENGQPAQ